MIKITHKGNLSATMKFVISNQKPVSLNLLRQYGEAGVKALSRATPVDTGKTSKSWSYKILESKGTITISFYNDNIQNGVPIAIVLQYGHGTRNGGWVQGRDYINPAIQPLFDKLANDAWKEVRKR